MSTSSDASGTAAATGPRAALGTPLLLFAACAVVGVLAALQRFTSAMNFPLVFGAVCLVFGLLTLRHRAGRALVCVLLVVLGPALAVGGWTVQNRRVVSGLVETRDVIAAALVDATGAIVDYAVGYEDERRLMEAARRLLAP
jgi:membrane-bound ClpP family serine protease